MTCKRSVKNILLAASMTSALVTLAAAQNAFATSAQDSYAQHSAPAQAPQPSFFDVIERSVDRLTGTTSQSAPAGEYVPAAPIPTPVPNAALFDPRKPETSQASPSADMTEQQQATAQPEPAETPVVSAPAPAFEDSPAPAYDPTPEPSDMPEAEIIVEVTQPPRRLPEDSDLPEPRSTEQKAQIVSEPMRDAQTEETITQTDSPHISRVSEPMPLRPQSATPQERENAYADSVDLNKFHSNRATSAETRPSLMVTDRNPDDVAEVTEVKKIIEVDAVEATPPEYKIQPDDIKWNAPPVTEAQNSESSETARPAPEMTDERNAVAFKIDDRDDMRGNAAVDQNSLEEIEEEPPFEPTVANAMPTSLQVIEQRSDSRTLPDIRQPTKLVPSAEPAPRMRSESTPAPRPERTTEPAAQAQPSNRLTVPDIRVPQAPRHTDAALASPAVAAETPTATKTPAEQTASVSGRAAAQVASLEFEGAGSDLSSPARQELDSIIDVMMNDESSRLQLRSYAASTDGSQSSARRIALGRGIEVRKYLMDQGVRSTRIDVRALGDETDRTPLDRVDMVFVQ